MLLREQKSDVELQPVDYSATAQTTIIDIIDPPPPPGSFDLFPKYGKFNQDVIEVVREFLETRDALSLRGVSRAFHEGKSIIDYCRDYFSLKLKYAIFNRTLHAYSHNIPYVVISLENLAANLFCHAYLSNPLVAIKPLLDATTKQLIEDIIADKIVIDSEAKLAEINKLKIAANQALGFLEAENETRYFPKCYPLSLAKHSSEVIRKVFSPVGNHYDLFLYMLVFGLVDTFIFSFLFAWGLKNTALFAPINPLSHAAELRIVTSVDGDSSTADFYNCDGFNAKGPVFQFSSTEALLDTYGLPVRYANDILAACHDFLKKCRRFGGYDDWHVSPFFNVRCSVPSTVYLGFFFPTLVFFALLELCYFKLVKLFFTDSIIQTVTDLNCAFAKAHSVKPTLDNVKMHFQLSGGFFSAIAKKTTEISERGVQRTSEPSQ